MLYCMTFSYVRFPTLIRPLIFYKELFKILSQNEYQIPYILLHMVSKIPLVPPPRLDTKLSLYIIVNHVKKSTYPTPNLYYQSQMNKSLYVEVIIWTNTIIVILG